MPESKARDRLRDRIFWAMTLLMSALGTCDRLRVAASAEKNKRMVGFAYNGSLPGRPHCDEAGHYFVNDHCERTLHGEMNLKDNTDQEKLSGSLVRVLATPCVRCLKELAGSGVDSIEYVGLYDSKNYQPTPENLREVFGEHFQLVHRELDWAHVFQEVFDKLAEPGGLFRNEGYLLKVIKEPLEPTPYI